MAGANATKRLKTEVRSAVRAGFGERGWRAKRGHATTWLLRRLCRRRWSCRGLVGRSLNTNSALVQAFLDNQIADFRVGRVEVYRWNTEIVPSQSLRARAGVP